jgi:hypothetical protein
VASYWALLLISLSLFVASGPARRAQAAPQNVCNPMDFVEVAITTRQFPSRGDIFPSMIARLGDEVPLEGRADHVVLAADCGLSRTPLPYTWSLARRDHGAPAAFDITGSLMGSHTLLPHFTATFHGVYEARLEAQGQVARLRIETVRPGLGWYSLGPEGLYFPSPLRFGTYFTGRVNALAYDPSNANILYAGSALGGVFKSLDRGLSWFPLMDQKNLPTLGIGALALSDDGTIYAGLGDRQSSRAVIAQSGGGIWKSSDGGETWTPAGTTLGPACPPGSVAFTGQAISLVVSQNDVVHVAAREGLFRSLDGGTCWRKVSPASVSSQPASDVALNPSDPNELYVAFLPNQLFKTNSAEAANPAWTRLTQPFTGTAVRIVLAIAPSQTNRIYAAFATNAGISTTASDNWGQTWTNPPVPIPAPGCSTLGYCDYPVALVVSPTNPDRVFYSEIPIWQSLDAGQTWTQFNRDELHADTQTLMFIPDRPDELYAGTDGGVFRSQVLPPGDPGPQPAWTPLNYGLSIAQGLTLGLGPRQTMVGLWDNGTQRRRLGRFWDAVGGGDGTMTAADVYDPVLPNLVERNILYANVNAGFDSAVNRRVESIFYTNASTRWMTIENTTIGFVQPISAFLADPFRAGRIYGWSAASTAAGPTGNRDGRMYGAEGLHQGALPGWRCTDPQSGPSTNPTVETLVIAPDDTLYAGLSNGRVASFNLPDSLFNIPSCVFSSNAQNVTTIYTATLANRGVRVALDPFNPNGLYVIDPGSQGSSRVTYLQRAGAPGLWTPTFLAGDPGDPGALPAVTFPMSAQQRNAPPAAADPTQNGVLWLGTTNGLWKGERQSGGGWLWSRSPDVPRTWITDIAAWGGALRLSTFGRGVWERNVWQVWPAYSLIGGSVTCLSCIERLPNPPILPIAGMLSANQPTEVTDSSSWAVFSVPYAYREEAGPSGQVRVTPLLGGLPLSGFISDNNKTEAGEDAALVSLYYADEAAPLAQFSDALLVELTDATGTTVVTSTVVPFTKLWLQPGARSLQVEATIVGLGEFPAPVPLMLTVGSEAPVTLAGQVVRGLPMDTLVSVEAPASYEDAGGKAEFEGWLKDGSLYSTEPKITVALDKDTNLVASYGREEEEDLPSPSLFLPLIAR